MRISDVGGIRDPLSICELYLGEDYRAPDRITRAGVGQVTYGRWQVDRLRGDGPIAEMPRPDPAQWHLYLLEVPHSLRFYSPDQTPQWVNVAFEVRGADATAYDILPRSVTEKPTGPATFTVSASLRFTGVDGGLRGSAHEIRLARLAPIVQSMGLGEGLFGWRYEAPPGEVMAVGDRTGCVILQVPKGTSEIDVRAAAHFPGNRRFTKGRSEPFSFPVALPG